MTAAAGATSSSSASPLSAPAGETSWREEISSKLRSYRARRRDHALEKEANQSALPFEASEAAASAHAAGVQTAVAEEELDDPLQTTLASAAARVAQLETSPESLQEEPVTAAEPDEPKMFEQLVIDVSRPPEPDLAAILRQQHTSTHTFAHPSSVTPVADLAARRRAFVVDAGCILLAFTCVLGLYLGFGGKLLATKLDVLVCGATLMLLYAQYFTLFTVMGGATPGMMFAGLRVVSFEGDAPAPVKLLWRSFGYLVSGIPALLGFCWALADEDHLTCHDRISQTYIAHAYALAENSAPSVDATLQHN